ncbi:hypothetical protein [Streptomyces sp. NBC_00829]|uniref:hypothetical protein n=1 Tax=Streptomyces sp. NBC_00829 TaxID=2903679 RepID=UPI0038632471|nr:hypothetical protein OG293_02115 [Streptomyces sp. NBC_00829]
MRVFDVDRQEWAGDERETRFDGDQQMQAAKQGQMLRRAVAVLAAVGLCFLVWALGWKDEPQPVEDAAPPQPTATESFDDGSSDEPSAESSETASAATVPADFAIVQDKEGFRSAVPSVWERSSRPSQYGMDVVEYSSPDGTRRLQVFAVMETSPYASLQAAQAEARKLDGYQVITLEEKTGTARKAATHEYRADEVAGEAQSFTRHVIDYRFEAEDGQRYALVAYGSDADGSADEQELLDTALTWFCPPGTVCPTPTG